MSSPSPAEREVGSESAKEGVKHESKVAFSNIWRIALHCEYSEYYQYDDNSVSHGKLFAVQGNGNWLKVVLQTFPKFLALSHFNPWPVLLRRRFRRGLSAKCCLFLAISWSAGPSGFVKAAKMVSFGNKISESDRKVATFCLANSVDYTLHNTVKHHCYPLFVSC